MNLLLDTNIIFNIIRAKDYAGIKNFINPNDSLLYISIVSDAEIKSLAIRNSWGARRMLILENFLEAVGTVDVNQLSVSIYAEIDAYSQRLNPKFGNYPFNTPRNIGKNDLWIASLASLLGLQLVTTDHDFDHLHYVFVDVRKIKPGDLARFF